MRTMDASRDRSRTSSARAEACAACGTPLAPDQRYCLQCGARRAGLGAAMALPATPVHAPGEPPPPPVGPFPLSAPWRSATLAGGVACLLLALLVGVLIGRSGETGTQPAAAPSVVTVAGAGAPTGGAAEGTAEAVSFTSDWPEGKKGFTVQLSALPKERTDAAAVAAAEQDAAAKGAPDVGALDSDQHGTLDPGQYVIFSGQFASKADASKSLAKLKSDFPGARVVEVASTRAKAQAAPRRARAAKAAEADAPKVDAATVKKSQEALKSLEAADTPEEYSKRSAKLPDTLASPGAPPPKDGKPAGGGTATETFE